MHKHIGSVLLLVRIYASQGCHNLFRRPARLPSRPDDNNQAHLKLGETRPPPPLDGEHSSFPGEPPSPSLEASSFQVFFFVPLGASSRDLLARWVLVPHP
ncbi:hypothetical protein CCHR01_08799 [Colletotrichum chrysophilum]|uniref:Secreted protein n=1 Tax=Colletotrichum chrysophilum TaxID=1836956 RepID=A0AAD9AKW3_9PEZI|nr:hypothetical protein CCHR01_08799 [Colletotrichum chrysophilum]